MGELLVRKISKASLIDKTKLIFWNYPHIHILNLNAYLLTKSLPKEGFSKVTEAGF
jgi:hypothetical protein